MQFKSTVKHFCLIASFLIASSSAIGQNQQAVQYLRGDSALQHSASHPCISEVEYQSIEAEIAKNVTALGLDKIHKASRAVTTLEWPLKPSSQLKDCGYYYISAFVDLNTTASAVQDWNCGSRTYDGHRGIDIVSWPFIWDKMDHNLVEVIAAAAGTIVAKVDGNPDRICNGVGGGSTSNNYITIQHADGSQALYIHLKTGSMTSKIVGQTVAVGEFLGIPGSAGQSTGQHLHFEVRSLGTFNSYIDPNFGTCNTGIGATWWSSQKPYTEPQLVKVSTHSNWPYFGVCPNTTDTTFYQDTFVSKAGGQANFHAFSKHVSSNDTWYFRILNPDNSVFDSWTYTSLSNRSTSILGWNKTLPTVPGTYIYEGSFKNVKCSHEFTVLAKLSIEPRSSNSNFHLFPNPSKGKVFIETDNLSAEPYILQVYSAEGKLIQTVEISYQKQEVNFAESRGIYFYKVCTLYGIVLQTGTVCFENK